MSDEELFKNAVNALVVHINGITKCMKEIRANYGISLHLHMMQGFDNIADVCVEKGLEKFADVLNKEITKSRSFRDRREFTHKKIDFYQYADPVTKHFTEADESTPKVKIV